MFNIGAAKSYGLQLRQPAPGAKKVVAGVFDEDEDDEPIPAPGGGGNKTTDLVRAQLEMQRKRVEEQMQQVG
jgi:hypothetical protein